MVLEFSPADPRSLLGHLLARLAGGVEALYTFDAGSWCIESWRACPRCGHYPVHGSHVRGPFEWLRLRLTEKRPFRCPVSGRRPIYQDMLPHCIDAWPAGKPSNLTYTPPAGGLISCEDD